MDLNNNKRNNKLIKGTIEEFVKAVTDNIEIQIQFNEITHSNIELLFNTIFKYKAVIEQIMEAINALKITITDHEYRLTKIELFLNSDSYYKDPPKVPTID